MTRVGLITPKDRVEVTTEELSGITTPNAPWSYILQEYVTPKPKVDRIVAVLNDDDILENWVDEAATPIKQR
jgi:hypothetical protein